MAQQLGFFFDSGSCSGCKACHMACRDKNDLDRDVTWRRVYEISGGEWKRSGVAWVPDIVAYNLSIACLHCRRPACLEACPTAAVRKRRDGVVFIDSNRCMGCGYCAWVCPYGAPQYDRRRGVMTKCDFCKDELDQGKAPACVSACPMRALDFGELSELQARHGDTARVYPLPDPALTEPALVVRPHATAERAEKAGARVSNPEET
jgi:anaerobic dimethyl sulfoxide reductase subunit B (iron-sulfur subunit)